MEEAIYETARRTERLLWLTAVLAAFACLFSFVAMQRAWDATVEARNATASASSAGMSGSPDVHSLRMDLIEAGVIDP